MANDDQAGSIANASKAADAGLPNDSRADGKDASRAACPVKVTVTIKLNTPVGCPGHPQEITAIGTPPDEGTYEWTVSGAELVDSSGGSPGSDSTVYLRSFQPDNGTGQIPEKNATVSVTYTHPCGTAKDSKKVKIHKIDIRATKVDPKYKGLEARIEQSMSQRLSGDKGVWIDSNDTENQTMNVDAEVTIVIDPSCPRKEACAANHQAGWLQDVIELRKSVRWAHRISEAQLKVGPPVRDATKGTDFPWYSDAIPFHLDFDSNSDTEKVNHSDSPGWGGGWTDPEPPNKAVDNLLQEIVFYQKFRAWLAVQNIEWSQHDMKNSFAFQKHFDWTVDHTVKASSDGGDSCSPRYSQPIPGDVGGGKGPDPSFTDMTIDEATKMVSKVLDPPAQHSSGKKRKH